MVKQKDSQDNLMSSHVGGVQRSNWNSGCANVQIVASIDEEVEDASVHREKGGRSPAVGQTKLIRLWMGLLMGRPVTGKAMMPP